MYKKTAVSVVFVLICVITIAYTQNPEISANSVEQLDLTGDLQEVNLSGTFNIDISEYHNLTGSQIYIDNTDPNYNWAKTALENEWCSGSGTWNDPYIIEYVYIDGQGDITPIPGKTYSENCLTVYRSNVHFVVRYCIFLDAGNDEYNAGIYLKDVENGRVYNNTIIYCHEGIYVDWYSFNNTIYQNRLRSNFVTKGHGGKAIFVAMQSPNNTLFDNYVLNYYTGIHVSESNNVTVEKNFVRNVLFGHEAESGIYIGRSDHCKIIKNILSGDWVSVSVEFNVSQEGCTGNIVKNNTVVSSGDISYKSDMPHTQGTFASLVSLSQSNYNVIAHNRYVIEVEGEDTPQESIPGYHIFFIVGLVCIITLLFTIRKHRNLQKRYSIPSSKCLFLSFFSSFRLKNC